MSGREQRNQATACGQSGSMVGHCWPTWQRLWRQEPGAAEELWRECGHVMREKRAKGEEQLVCRSRSSE